MRSLTENKADDYPKVLIVNAQSILCNNATGITLRSLWNGWPKDRLLEIHESSKTEGVQDVDFNTIKIPDSDFLFKKFIAGKTGNNLNTALSKAKADNDGKRNTPSSNVKNKIRQLFACIFNASPSKIDKKILEIIKAFNPDVIYTLGGNVTILNLCYKLSKLLNKKIVIHYMDNWPEHLQWEDNKLLYLYKKLLDRSLRKCLKRSQIGITISDSMAQRYNQTLGMQHSVLMNSVNVNDFLTLESTHHTKKTFLYAGGLHLDRWKSLLEVAKCMDGQNAIFEIYTNRADQEKYAEYFKGYPVTFHDTVSHDCILRVYDRADVLVHAENDNPVMQGFFKYSVSTKIPEYLATGKPVLFYGPEELGLYQYLNDNQIAVCAKNETELKDTVSKLCADDYDCSIGQRARNFVIEKHDIGKAREILKETMIAGC